jgi:hypothetical protein
MTTGTRTQTDRRHWVFRDPCGCAFGVLDFGPHAGTRSKAWRDFYDTAKERNAAVDRGVTCDEVTHEVYVADFHPMMRTDWTCPHGVSS